ncbi:hypothetical protein POJ06DRAFT_276987 [Lipomyces tetrasporus]|uniref:Uncharacterized protein n=1 Tax=Lipomyces tetrasporus TaxID=54092 RepID=A0AAD7QNH1_9ASCO|nr:uncharacterized protein POJ06DRAFT_276987 [Lipomyces tetrasporus]KAJ8098539.1 hypothetical protein POJ06DRAFT_276987 [Lipomyces tetrasporus]
MSNDSDYIQACHDDDASICEGISSNIDSEELSALYVEEGDPSLYLEVLDEVVLSPNAIQLTMRARNSQRRVLSLMMTKSPPLSIRTVNIVYDLTEDDKYSKSGALTSFDTTNEDRDGSINDDNFVSGEVTEDGDEHLLASAYGDNDSRAALDDLDRGGGFFDTYAGGSNGGGDYSNNDNDNDQYAMSDNCTAGLADLAIYLAIAFASSSTGLGAVRYR